MARNLGSGLAQKYKGMGLAHPCVGLRRKRLPAAASMQKIVITSWWLLCTLPCLTLGQVADNFSDGDFTQNPPWAGTTTYFRIENGALRYEGPALSNTAYLSTQFLKNLNSGRTEWYFTLNLLEEQLDGLNTVRVYLTADVPFLDLAYGYFLQCGGSNGSTDPTRLRLVRADATGTTLVLETAAGTFAPTDVLQLRVERSPAGTWQLDRWDARLGNYQPLAAGADPTFSTTAYFGVYTRHQGSYAKGFYLDAIQAGDLPPDITPPQLVRVEAEAFDTLVLTFSEPLSVAAGIDEGRYNLNGGLQPARAEAVALNASQVRLAFPGALIFGNTYTLNYQNVDDLLGNAGTGSLTFTYIPPSRGQPGEVVISEVLFDPLAGEVRYLELYNTGPSPVDIRMWQIARGTRDTTELTPATLQIFPGEWHAFTEDPTQVSRRYESPPEARIHPWPNLPAYDRSHDTLTLLRADGTLIDQIQYDATWHSPWLVQKTGVALERLSPLVSGHFKSNWASAASTQAFGTPGYENSVQTQQSHYGRFRLINEDFSPDGDGYRDQLQLELAYSEPGWRADIRLFTANGRLVRTLSPALLPTQPVIFSWDGISDSGSTLAQGFYLALVQLQHPDGRTDLHKAACVLARPR